MLVCRVNPQTPPTVIGQYPPLRRSLVEGTLNGELSAQRPQQVRGELHVERTKSRFMMKSLRSGERAAVEVLAKANRGGDHAIIDRQSRCRQAQWVARSVGTFVMPGDALRQRYRHIDNPCSECRSYCDMRRVTWLQSSTKGLLLRSATGRIGKQCCNDELFRPRL